MLAVTVVVALLVGMGWIGVAVLTLPMMLLGWLVVARNTRSWVAAGAGIAGTTLVAGCVFVLALVGSGAMGEGARRQQCAAHLRQIVLAAALYSDHYHGQPPPAIVYDAEGKAVTSWRTLLMPFHGYPVPPANRTSLGPMLGRSTCQPAPEIYRCRADESRGPEMTSYVGIYSSDRPADSRLLGLIEVHTSGIGWCEPRDIEVSALPALISRKSHLKYHNGSFHVVIPGGQVVLCTTETFPWSAFGIRKDSSQVE